MIIGLARPLTDVLKTGLQQPWTSLYTKLLALVLVYGMTVHISNIVGLTGQPWLSTPVLWRGMDLVLLVFKVVIAVGIWRGSAWSVWLLFSGMVLLQFLPYTLLRSHFILNPGDAQTLNGLLGMEALFLVIFAILLGLKK